jgi:hypothetical protein
MTSIIADVETFPLDDVEQYLTPLPEIQPPDLGLIAAAKNLVDPVKIAADIEKRRVAAVTDYHAAIAAQQAQWQALIDGCSLEPDLGRIVACGWMFIEDAEPRVLVCQSESEERDALDYFARDYAATTNPQIVTFNGLRFDLLYMMRRATFLGVRFPILNVDRYRTPHLDLQAILSYNGILKFRSLKFYLNRFGLQNDDLTTGKDITSMVRAGDWEGVKAHNRADVIGTKLLAQRLGLIERTRPAVAEGAF